MAILKISGVASAWERGKFIFPILREDLVIVFAAGRAEARVLALLSSVGAALLQSGGDTL